MDDGETVYGVLKKLYDSPKKKAFKDLRKEERYLKKDSKLGNAGKKQRVYSIIHRLNVLNISALVEEAEKEEVSEDELEAIIEDLKSRGLIYEPEPGVLGFAGD